MHNFSGVLANSKQGQIKVQSPLSPSFPSIPSEWEVFSPFITLFPFSFDIPHMSLFFFPHTSSSAFSICALLSLHQCDLLLGPRGGIQWGVLWCVTLVFSTVTHLFSSCSPLSDWLYLWEYAASVCVCVYFYLIILYDLLHLFGCRCLGTHPPQPRVWVSWISWVTPSQKSTTKSQRYTLYSRKHTNMPMSC